jgi:hypothetical protein
MSKLAEFLSGDRLDDVALFVSHDYLDDQGKIANLGDPVDDGVVLVVEGDKGRQAFSAGTGLDAMQFAKGAMQNDGRVDADLGGGVCPDAGDDEGHEVEFVLAFSEAQNEEVGGVYADGDVIHAYAHCTCGTSFSDRWVVGERDVPGEA